MAIELQPLVLESTLTMQKILECPDHTSRLKLLRLFVEAETKRLTTKKAIQNMFAGKSLSSELGTSVKKEPKMKDNTISSSSSSSSFPSEEQISSSSSDESSSSSSTSRSFFNEDDAFQ
jgi:hypothetical protein